MVGLTIPLVLKEHRESNNPCDPDASICTCYVHRLYRCEESMNELLEPVDITNKALFVNRVKALYLDLPCYIPKTGSSMNERGDALIEALENGSLPYLKVLQVKILEFGSHLLTREENDELLERLTYTPEVCKQRKISWKMLLETDAESYWDEES